jgi:hypothetical protein
MSQHRAFKGVLWVSSQHTLDAVQRRALRRASVCVLRSVFLWRSKAQSDTAPQPLYCGSVLNPFVSRSPHPHPTTNGSAARSPGHRHLSAATAVPQQAPCGRQQHRSRQTQPRSRAARRQVPRRHDGARRAGGKEECGMDGGGAKKNTFWRAKRASQLNVLCLR